MTLFFSFVNKPLQRYFRFQTAKWIIILIHLLKNEFILYLLSTYSVQNCSAYGQRHTHTHNQTKENIVVAIRETQMEMRIQRQKILF